MSKAKLMPDRDHWQSVLAAILLAKAAIATFSIAPFLIGGYIDQGGLTPREASQLLSVEIFGIALANILAAIFWVHRAACRKLARILLVTLIALNLLCAVTSGFGPLFALRALCGLTEGSMLAIGFGLLSSTARPDRNFGLMFAISLGIGALNVQLLPLFLEDAGTPGLFANLGCYSLAALVMSGFVPSGRLASDPSRSPGIPGGQVFPALALGFLLVANYIYFIGQGGLWSFLERWGLQQSLDLTTIANALSVSLFAGVAGGLFAAWLDVRAGRLLPLCVAISGAMLAILALYQFKTVWPFVAASAVFMFMNNFGHPYILGLASRIDDSSRLTVLSGALHTGGQATGPLIVGMVVSKGDYANALWVSLVFFAASLIILIPVSQVADRVLSQRA